MAFWHLASWQVAKLKLCKCKWIFDEVDALCIAVFTAMSGVGIIWKLSILVENVGAVFILFAELLNCWIDFCWIAFCWIANQFVPLFVSYSQTRGGFILFGKNFVILFGWYENIFLFGWYENIFLFGWYESILLFGWYEHLLQGNSLKVGIELTLREPFSQNADKIRMCRLTAFAKKK